MSAIENARAITEPTTATPAEIDTALMNLDGEIQRAYTVLANKDLAHLHPQFDAVREAAQAEFVRLDAERDRRGGWTRYLAVSGGHVHSEYRCAGLKWTTRRCWFPALSGIAVEQAIDEFDEGMCTHCFPNAPVRPALKPDQCPGSDGDFAKARCGYYSGNWVMCPECGKKVGCTTNPLRVPKHDTPEADARKLAAKAKAAGKIVMPDGSLKTERAIWIMATQPAFDLCWYSETHPWRAKWISDRDQAIALLVGHTGRPEQEIRDEVERRAQAKYKRER